MTGESQPRSGCTQFLLRSFRFLTLIALVTLLLAATSIGALAWMVSDRALNPDPSTYPWTVEDFDSLDPEPIIFQSASGIALSGRFFPSSSGATVILSHGFAATQDQVLPWVYLLNEAGFNVLTYDMRSRGRSGGKYVTFGALEQYDLIAAVDYLITRDDVDADRIAAAGLSLGGSVSILAAAHDPRIRAVVSVSGFSDLHDVVSDNFERFFDLPAFPFSPVSIAISEYRSGASIGDVEPESVIGLISPRPVLLIHGSQDELVSAENGARNFAAAREPKEIVWVANGGHDLREQLFWGEAREKVIEFLLSEL